MKRAPPQTRRRVFSAPLAASRRSAMGRDAWMLKQQLRAESEAQRWRQLREESVFPPFLIHPAQKAMDHHRSGSATLKALVRFGLATLGAHAAGLTAAAAQLGQFEVWLAMVAGFVMTLALSMFGAARGFVHLLSQAMGWTIVAAVGASSLWLAFQFFS